MFSTGAFAPRASASPNEKTTVTDAKCELLHNRLKPDGLCWQRHGRFVRISPGQFHTEHFSSVFIVSLFQHVAVCSKLRRRLLHPGGGDGAAVFSPSSSRQTAILRCRT